LPKAAVFEAMGYKIYADEVKRFHESKAHIRIPTAPARSSKSYSAAPEVVYRALPHRPLVGSLQWIVGTDYPTNKEFQYVWSYLVEQRERWSMGSVPISIEKAQNNPQNGSMIIVIDWGKGPHGRARAIIEGKSSTNERALQGEHVTQAVLSEAAEHPERIWTKYLSTRSTHAIFPTTPKPHAEWLHQMVEMGEKDPSLSIESFTFPPHANPYYDAERFERERKKAERRADSGNAEDDPYFAEQFLGKWVYYTGMVLPLKDKNVVTLDEGWLENARLFVSCDFGYEDACVALFWALLPSGALIVFDEIYERHLTTFQFVDRIASKLSGREKNFVYATGDPKQPQVARYLTEFGLKVIDVNKKAQVDRAVGHRRLVDLMTIDPAKEHPMLFIAQDRCPKTLAEWRHLRYRPGMRDEYGSAALEGDDHAYDAARYFVMTRPQLEPEKREPDWVREVQRRRRREQAAQNFYKANRGLERVGYKRTHSHLVLP